MPSKSKSQQRFWGMVYDCKENGNCPDEKIKDVAKSVKKKVVREYAETKHKGLPDKVKKKKKKSKKKSKSSIVSRLSGLQKHLFDLGLNEEAGSIGRVIIKAEKLDDEA